MKRWKDMNRDEATFRNGIVEYNGQRTQMWRLLASFIGCYRTRYFLTKFKW